MPKGSPEGYRRAGALGGGGASGMGRGGSSSLGRSAKKVPLLKAQKPKTTRPKTLYHGTGSDVKPGRKLLPSSSATKYYEFADRFAKMSGPNSKVYKVKAPSDTRKIPKWDAARQDEWQSQSGFTVVKEARVPKRTAQSKPQMRTAPKPNPSKPVSSRQAKGPGRK